MPKNSYAVIKDGLKKSIEGHEWYQNTFKKKRAKKCFLGLLRFCMDRDGAWRDFFREFGMNRVFFTVFMGALVFLGRFFSKSVLWGALVFLPRFFSKSVFFLKSVFFPKSA